MPSSLSGLARKAAAGTPISDAEARDLMATTDLVTVGMIATEARRLKVGDRVTYVRVAEIAFNLAAAAPAAVGGVVATAADATAASASSASASASTSGSVASAGAPAAWPPAAAREIRITGTPGSIGEAIASVRAAVLSIGASTVPAAAGLAEERSMDSAATQSALIPLTAFSLADLWMLAGGDAAKMREFAQALRDAGVAAIAEVPVDQFSNHAAAAAALDAVLGAGLLAPAATWHGGAGAPEDPVASLRAVHALQEQTHAFRAFAPLARQPSVAQPSTGYEDVKIVAVARAVLNNVDHIQVDWATHGPKLAQVALLFGASDLDRVSPSDEAPLGHRRAPIEEVQRNVKSAFLDPVERDGRFEQVVR